MFDWMRYSPKRQAVASPMVAAIAMVAGCASWHHVDLAADRLVQEQKPEAVRVTRLDSSRVVLRAPQVIGDSLVGNIQTPDGGKQRTSVFVDSVKSIEVHKINAGRTALVVIGTAGVVFAVLCTQVEGVCFPGD